MKDWQKNLEEEDTRRLTKTWLASVLCVPVDKTNSDLENLLKQFPMIIHNKNMLIIVKTRFQSPSPNPPSRTPILKPRGLIGTEADNKIFQDSESDVVILNNNLKDKKNSSNTVLWA